MSNDDYIYLQFTCYSQRDYYEMLNALKKAGLHDIHSQLCDQEEEVQENLPTVES